MNQTKEHYHAYKQKCHVTIKFKHIGYDVLWLSKGVEHNTIINICIHDW